ncbi:hypothetical protein B0H17DRAFT_1196476 [Mycena rosella]|uniref:Uncharacterized protein n=1 Tax=Mycena rosella TaxID=1033263 RepID=A0AAD7GPZ8_MYCRO|nr:hypothetical protein B0H17DRAFT_1196476 [Mycena rosella]
MAFVPNTANHRARPKAVDDLQRTQQDALPRNAGLLMRHPPPLARFWGRDSRVADSPRRREGGLVADEALDLAPLLPPPRPFQAQIHPQTLPKPTRNPPKPPTDMHLQSIVSPLLKVSRGLQNLVGDGSTIAQLAYTIARLEAQLAESEAARMALANSNEGLSANAYYLGGELQQALAEAAQLRALAEYQQSLIQFGLDAVQHMMEEGCRADVQARQTQMVLIEEIAKQEGIIKVQDANIQVLLEADADAQVTVAHLHARLADNAAVEESAKLKIAALESKLEQIAATTLKDVQHAQLDRDLVHSKTVAKQAAEIAALESKIEDLKAGVLLRYQEVRDAHANRERAAVDTIASQAKTIENLHATVHDLQATALASKAAGAATIKALSTMVEELKAKELAANAARDARAATDGAIIYKLKTKTNQLKAKAKKTAAEVLLKDQTIAQLGARIQQLGAEALDAATKAVANQLQVTEHLQALELRAVDAEEKAEKLRRDSKTTVKTLAALHAKELAAACVRPATVADVDATMVDAPKTSADTDMDVVAQSPPAVAADVSATIPAPQSADFSFDCPFYFSTRFVVRADSSFAQASIAAPAHFTREERHIVRRGANSAVTPLLLPAWPGCAGRVEDSRSSKRSRWT